MARQSSQSYQRTLRRYALAGNVKACRELLQQRLEAAPHDNEAREELERLEAGRPLLATENARQRKRREAADARDKMLQAIAKNPESELSTKSTASLLELKEIIDQSQQKIKRAAQKDSPALSAYRATLLSELRRRGLGRMRRVGVLAGSILGGLALLTGIGMLCYKRASDFEADLRTALKQNAWERVESISAVANTPFNRFLCSELEKTILDANRWMTHIENRRRWLDKHIVRIESGQGNVSDMRMSLRAEIERELSSMPADFNSLTTRWQKLCDKERAALEHQKSRLVHELVSPLSDLPVFKGAPEQDAELLTELRREARNRHRLFRDAPQSYQLAPSLAAPAQERLVYIRECLAEIEAYKDQLNRLSYQRTYKDYQETLHSFHPRHYTPAVELLKVCSKLPAEENVKSLMLDPEQKNDANETQAAVATLLDGGPTFTQAYPATQQQVNLMEELFAAPSLNVCLYEITNADGELCYSEQEPTLDAQKRVHVKRSDLDPAYQQGNRDICWDDASSVWKRTIDTRPLYKAVNIDKPSFFRDRNLPQLLTTVLNFRHRDCPALARAVIYHRLLMLIREHKTRTLTGISYSPTLRKHAASFLKLVRKHGIELRSGCWLSKSPQMTAAEQEFEAWFRANRGTDYVREIRQNFGPLIKVGVRFSGYINEQGQPVIFRNLHPDTAIWYLSESHGVIATRVDAAPEAPVPLSPIFTASRQ
ncbi:MAG: hypothetical protein II295_08085 [Akkermansia sp.]|nr:hypothetical protein [Akkermansia sp.]